MHAVLMEHLRRGVRVGEALLINWHAGSTDGMSGCRWVLAGKQSLSNVMCEGGWANRVMQAVLGRDVWWEAISSDV